MRRNESVLAVVVLSLLPITTADAQWLNQPTPNIPRTADGKPDLAAPPPRGADGHPDLSGLWVRRAAARFRFRIGRSPRGRETLIREREETYFKDRPSFQCQPTGPEADRPGGGGSSRRPLSSPSPTRHLKVSPHLHGRAPPRGRSRAHMDGVFRWPMGRGHAGGRQLRVQRSDVARCAWPAPYRGAPHHRTIPSAIGRTTAGRAHRDRSRRVRSSRGRSPTTWCSNPIPR